MTQRSVSQSICLLACLVLLLAVAACTNQPDAIDVSTSITPIRTEPLVTEISTPSAPLESNTPPSPVPDDNTFRIWIDDAFATQYDNTEELSPVTSQLQAFATAHPELDLMLEVKSVDGNGSILNYLRYGGDVAPSILPDVILLPTSKLSPAATNGLIYPLSDQLAASAQADLYPAVVELAEVDGLVVGYPVVLEALPVVVHRTDLFTGTVPITWDELATREQVQLGIDIPAQGANLLLSLYLGSGATLQDEANQLQWNEQALIQALTRLQTARNNGIFPDATLSANSAENVWQLLEDGSVNAILTTTDAWLQQKDRFPNLRVTPVPGINAPLPAQLCGWGWAISTPDVDKQAVSAEFIAHMVNPENLGTWTYNATALPATQTALQEWPIDDNARGYIIGELTRAQSFPKIVDETTAQLLQEAVARVLIIGESPATAADRIINR